MERRGLQEHRDIILEALTDYRRWREPNSERVNEIDGAIAFVETA